jgi:hypothetical protein
VQVQGTETGIVQEVSDSLAPELQSNSIEFNLLLQIGEGDTDPTPPDTTKVLLRTKSAIDSIAIAIATITQRSVEELKGETLGFGELAFVESSKVLLPWLSPFTGIQIESSSQYSNFTSRFNMSEPLAGQSAVELDLNVCTVKVIARTYEELGGIGVEKSAIGSLIPDLLLMNVILDEVHFQQGSLYAWIKLHIKILTLGAALLGPAVTIASPAITKGGENVVAAMTLHQHIEAAIKSAPFVQYRNLMFSEDELVRTAGRAFNYEERGISKDERRRRIALVQLALRVNLNAGLVIDGELGPDTIQQMKEFGKRHNVPPDVRNPFFDAALRDALVPKPIFGS